jgi:hypothetical protein
MKVVEHAKEAFLRDSVAASGQRSGVDGKLRFTLLVDGSFDRLPRPARRHPDAPLPRHVNGAKRTDQFDCE